MFVDYYKVLDIEKNATLDEIKTAFKKQAIKWHPDRNSNIDTTNKMQEINEAYLILKDSEARKKYDLEYTLFYSYKKQEENVKEKKVQNTEYEIQDEELKKWMDNAKRQAVDLAKQTIRDFKGIASEGIREGVKGAGKQFFYQILAGIILLILFKMCKS